MQVLTLTPSGSIGLEEIFMISHQMDKVQAQFVTLRLANNRSISASPGHYVWAGKPDQAMSEAVPTRAEDVLLGDWLLSSDTTGAGPNMVAAKEYTIQNGLFNPHTPSGSILVNGVAALTFTDTLPRSVAIHTAITAPARLLYSVCRLFDIMPACNSMNSAFLATYHAVQHDDKAVVQRAMLAIGSLSVGNL